jgi:multidrug efflux pump subunit AcrA (membrane-fusion protein)
VAGEVVPASGRSLVVAAPVAGTLAPSSPQGLHIGQTVRRGEALVRLTPVATVDRDVRAQSERALSAAETRLTAAEARATRTEKLVADGAASAQKLEEAREARDVSKAERDAAKERAAMLARSPLESDVGVVLRAPEDGVIRALGLGTSGMVASGAPLVEIVGTSALWVRASLFVGDLRKIRPEASARVRPLTEAPGMGEVEALPLAGPPTADGTSASFDVYYALGKEASFRPGERVAVTLPYGARMPSAPSAPAPASRQVPASAVMRDAYGGAWVYAVVGKYTYERRRLEVSGAEAGLVTFESGPALGTAIVTTGAAELFGFEITGK